VTFIKLTKCEPNGAILRSVWINPDQIIWVIRNDASSYMTCRDDETTNIIETPEEIMAIINPPAPPAQKKTSENPPAA
jgi:hypothetical protein